MLVLTKAALKLALAALVDHTASGNFDGPFRGVYVGLYTAGPTPSDSTLRADLTEATYTGYARQQITPWGASYQDAAGDYQIDSPLLQFQPSDGVTPNTIIGYGLFDASTNGNLMALEAFASAVPLPSADSALPIVVSLKLPTTADFGDATVVE